VSYFLVIYDRRKHHETVVERIEDEDAALTRLFQLEDQLLGSENGQGVVLLVADDEEEIRRTHSHYFKSFDELRELA
jgi:hypothetical protein